MYDMTSWHRWQVATGVADTGRKFAAGITAIGLNLGKEVAASVVDTGGKLAADCHRHRWSTCLRLSTTSVVNLPPIVNDIGVNFCRRHRLYRREFSKICTCSHLLFLSLSSLIFRDIAKNSFTHWLDPCEGLGCRVLRPCGRGAGNPGAPGRRRGRAETPPDPEIHEKINNEHWQYRYTGHRNSLNYEEQNNTLM